MCAEHAQYIHMYIYVQNTLKTYARFLSYVSPDRQETETMYRRAMAVDPGTRL